MTEQPRRKHSPHVKKSDPRVGTVSDRITQQYDGGRVAVMTASATDFRDTGAQRDETENLINEPLRIAGVGVSVLLVEDGDQIRGSLRSKVFGEAGAGDVVNVVDVATVAETLGGGGHARAAGFRMVGTLAEVTARAVAAVAKALE